MDVFRKSIAIATVTLVLALMNGTLAWSADQGKYSVAGVDDAASFDHFYTELRTAILKEDRQTVSSLWAYPMVFPLANKKTLALKNQSDLVKNYDLIFTDEVKAAFKRTELSKVFCNYQGFMVGDGEMWIRPASKPGTFFIVIINSAAPH